MEVLEVIFEKVKQPVDVFFDMLIKLILFFVDMEVLWLSMIMIIIILYVLIHFIPPLRFTLRLIDKLKFTSFFVGICYNFFAVLNRKSENIQRLLKPALVAFFASAPYLCSLNGDFVFDDSEAVLNNKDVFSESWRRAFYNDFWGTSIRSNDSHKSYRPLTILTFRLNYFLNNQELSAFQFKATNVLIHTINCILVSKLYDIIIKDFNYKTPKMWYYNVSVLSALLFSVHTVHVEAVSGIVGRADLLACLTFLLSFICYRKSMAHTEGVMYVYLTLSVIIAGISMLFKENGITVVGFCIAYDVIHYLQRQYSTKFKSKKTALGWPSTNPITRIGITILNAMIMLYVRWYIMGSAKPVFKEIDNPAAFSEDLRTRLLTYNYIYFLNFFLFIWPYWCCYDWSMGCVPRLQSVWDYRTIFVVLMYLYGFMLLRTIYLKRKDGFGGLILVTSLLIVIPFLPASNIFFPVGFVIAERILYIPSIGYCLLLGIGFQKMKACQGKYIKTSLFYVLLLLYGHRTLERGKIWRYEYDLFKSALDVCPLNAKVHYNMAKVQETITHPDSKVIAENEYREALRLYPEYYQAMNNLANLLKNKNEYVEAKEYLLRATSLKRNFPAAWMNLGIVLASTKEHTEAERAYKTALGYRENYPDCLYNLGNLYLEMKRPDDAVKSYIQAIELNSTHVLAWSNLLVYLDDSRQHKKALELIPTAMSVLPESARVNYAIANIYGKLNRFEESEHHFYKAIRLFGSRVRAINFCNFGILYHRWKKYEKAEEMYRKALEFDPNFASALKHLKSLSSLKRLNRKNHKNEIDSHVASKDVLA